jgi:D-alanine-D-alanine ligase-like ATP-grasp enzyme
VPTVPAKLTHLLARRGGRVGRTLAPVVDLAAAVGPRDLLTRRREEREYARRSLKYRVNLRIWSEAARACGGFVRELDGGSMEIVVGDASVRVRMQATPLDGEVTLRLALDKTATQSLLRVEGLPVPEYLGFDLADPSSALRLLEAGGAWVVKPADGGGSGQGTTTGVRTKADFLRASARASRAGRRLLVERQIPGEEYRLLFLDGELLGAVRRSPPSLVGDGESSVAQLVHAENRRRLDALGEAGVMLITLDLDALLTLARDGGGPRTVPPAGAEVTVKTARNQAGRRDSEAVEPGAFAAELVDEARRATAAVGLRLAGVDLIAPDPGRSLTASGGAIIEVNGTPGLHYHYLVRNPAATTPVAVPILTKMLEAQTG